MLTRQPVSLRWWLVLVVLATRSLLAGPAAAQPIPPDFRVGMTTGACLGGCVSYHVEIDAAGHVRFTGTFENGVTDAGVHEFQVPEEDVRVLLRRVQQLDFFNLADRYHSGTVTDLPSVTFEATANGRSKRVFNYDGGPPALDDLSRDLARLGRSARWVVSDADALRDYLRDHPKPPAVALPRLASTALRVGALDLLKQVLAFGLTTDDLADLVKEADTAEQLDVMLAAGAPADRRPGDRSQSLLMNAAQEGDLARVNRLLAAGVAVDATTDHEETALWFAACGLHPEVVARLLAAGARPDVTSTLPRMDSDAPLPAVECPNQSVADIRHAIENAPPGDPNVLPDAIRAAEKTTALLRAAINERTSPARRPR